MYIYEIMIKGGKYIYVMAKRKAEAIEILHNGNVELEKDKGGDYAYIDSIFPQKLSPMVTVYTKPEYMDIHLIVPDIKRQLKTF